MEFLCFGSGGLALFDYLIFIQSYLLKRSWSLIVWNWLNFYFICESLQDISSFYYLNFLICIFLNEFFSSQESTTNFYIHLISLFNFDINLFLTKSIHTFRLSQEQNLDLFLFRISVDKAGQSFIDLVVSLGQILMHNLITTFNLLLLPNYIFIKISYFILKIFSFFLFF